MDAGDLPSESELQPSIPLGCLLPRQHSLPAPGQDQSATESGRCVSLPVLQAPGPPASVAPSVPRPPRGQPLRPSGNGAHCPRQGKVGPRGPDLSGLPASTMVKHIKRHHSSSKCNKYQSLRKCRNFPSFGRN